MKKVLLIVSAVISLSSFAQERVLLNAENIEVNAPEAILVRTSETPRVVKITFNVPMSKSICEAYSTRYVFVTSGYQCGYDRRMTGYTTRTICTRMNPQNGQCLRTETQRVPVISNYPRTCQVPETYCSSYGTLTNLESDKVKIKFKNLPALGATEEDSFLVKAKQKRYDGVNVVYEITPQQTVTDYIVSSRGLLGFDSFIVSEK